MWLRYMAASGERSGFCCGWLGKIKLWRLIVQKISLFFFTHPTPPPPPPPHHTHGRSRRRCGFIVLQRCYLPQQQNQQQQLPLNRRRDPSREFPTTRYS